MKKILFLLLVTISSYGQTYQNPTFGTIKTKTAPTVTSTTYLGTIEADGTISKITPANLPVSTSTTNALELKANKDSGLLYGGIISINTDPTKWDLASGSGYITNSLTGIVTPVSWSTQLALTTPYLASSVATYVLINSSGSVVTQNSAPTQQQYRTHIYLGKLAHTTFTTILFAVSEPSRMFDISGQVSDLNRFLGSGNVDGNTITYNGANLNINASAGMTYRAGANYATDRNSPSITTEPAFTAGTFRNKFRNGSGGWNAVNTTTIDPNYYDNGSGILQLVPNNKWTVKVFWRFGGTGTIHCDYGQVAYDNKVDALAAAGRAAVSEDPETKRDASRRAWLVVQQGVTVLNDLTKAEFIPADKLGERSAGSSSIGTLQTAYNNSTIPQITTTTALGAVTVQRGSASDTDNIIVGKNNAGTTTFSVTGTGNITGGTYNGYTPENSANKATDFTTVNNTLYPSVQAVKNELDLKTNNSTVQDFAKSYISPYETGNIRNTEADLIKLNNGNYLVGYSRFFRQATDFSPSIIAGRISTDGGVSWGEEFEISSNIGTINVLSVSLIRLDASTIQCLFLVRNSFTDLELYRTTSTDEGVTWGAAVKITNNGYTDVLNSSVKRVNSNRILISAESTPDGSVGSPTWDIFTYYSDDNGATYTKSNIVHVATSEGETSVCWLGGNNVLLSTRSTDGFQWFTKSTNNGATWGTPYQSTLKSTAAPAQIVNYSGTLIALHNSNTVDDIRNPLTISKSLDGGDTWVEIDNLNLPRESYYSYAYPSITIDGDNMLITYYEISGDAGVGLKFSKINIPDLLTGVKPGKSSPDELYLDGLTFDKSETIQPQDDVLTAFGKIQSQINKKEGEAFTYKGVGPGIIFQNDQPDNVMDLQFMDFKNTDGSLVSRIGHLDSSEKLYFLSDKTIRVETPLFEVNSPTNVAGLLTVERNGSQAYFKGSDQGAFDIEKVGGYKYRVFVDTNTLGLYNFNNGIVPLEIANATGVVSFSQIPTAPTAAPGSTGTQIANLDFVNAKVGSFVDLTTSQTITGSKSFTNSTNYFGNYITHHYLNNPSNAISWSLREGGASQGQFSLGTNTVKIEMREAGPRYISVTDPIESPAPTAASHLVNKTYSDKNNLIPYTFATLPASPSQGDSYSITDALAPAYLAPAAGGGSVFCPVVWNGTAWVCH